MNGYLNLLEFIKHLGLNMVLNNEIIKYDEFELLNRDELWKDFIVDMEDENLDDEELEEFFAGISILPIHALIFFLEVVKNG